MSSDTDTIRYTKLELLELFVRVQDPPELEIGDRKCEPFYLDQPAIPLNFEDFDIESLFAKVARDEEERRLRGRNTSRGGRGGRGGRQRGRGKRSQTQILPGSGPTRQKGGKASKPAPVSGKALQPEPVLKRWVPSDAPSSLFGSLDDPEFAQTKLTPPALAGLMSTLEEPSAPVTQPVPLPTKTQPTAEPSQDWGLGFEPGFFDSVQAPVVSGVPSLQPSLQQTGASQLSTQIGGVFGLGDVIQPMPSVPQKPQPMPKANPRKPFGWFYRDDCGQIRGPFPSRQMQAWLEHYFSREMPVACTLHREFHPLRTWLMRSKTFPAAERELLAGAPPPKPVPKTQPQPVPQQKPVHTAQPVIPSGSAPSKPQIEEPPIDLTRPKPQRVPAIGPDVQLRDIGLTIEPSSSPSAAPSITKTRSKGAHQQATALDALLSGITTVQDSSVPWRESSTSQKKETQQPAGGAAGYYVRPKRSSQAAKSAMQSGSSDAVSAPKKAHSQVQPQKQVSQKFSSRGLSTSAVGSTGIQLTMEQLIRPQTDALPAPEQPQLGSDLPGPGTLSFPSLAEFSMGKKPKKPVQQRQQPLTLFGAVAPTPVSQPPASISSGGPTTISGPSRRVVGDFPSLDSLSSAPKAKSKPQPPTMRPGPVKRASTPTSSTEDQSPKPKPKQRTVVTGIDSDSFWSYPTPSASKPSSSAEIQPKQKPKAKARPTSTARESTHVHPAAAASMQQRSVETPSSGEVSPEFRAWALEEMRKLRIDRKVDPNVFFNCMVSAGSDRERQEYGRGYVGRSRDIDKFCSEFSSRFAFERPSDFGRSTTGKRQKRKKGRRHVEQDLL